MILMHYPHPWTMVHNPLASMHFHCHELSMDHPWMIHWHQGFPWTSKDWALKVWYQTTPPCTLPLSHDVWTNKKSFPGWTIQDAKHTIAAQEGIAVKNQRLLKGMTGNCLLKGSRVSCDIGPKPPRPSPPGGPVCKKNPSSLWVPAPPGKYPPPHLQKTC